MSAPCLPHICYSCYLSNLYLPVWYLSSCYLPGPCLPDTCYYYLSGLFLPVWYLSLVPAYLIPVIIICLVSSYLSNTCLLVICLVPAYLLPDTCYHCYLSGLYLPHTCLLVICLLSAYLSTWYLLLLSVWSLSTSLPDTQETVFFCNVRTMFQVVPMRINGAGTNQLYLKDFDSFSLYTFSILLKKKKKWVYGAGRDLLPF